MIESGTLYEQLQKDHEQEDYRQDTHWVLEVESLGKAHLVKALELPLLTSLGKMLVAREHEPMTVVLRLSVKDNVEAKIRDLLLGHTKCKAALYMLGKDGKAVASTWIFEDFEFTGMKLQNFDRDRPPGTIDLAVTCGFQEVKIV